MWLDIKPTFEYAVVSCCITFICDF